MAHLPPCSHLFPQVSCRTSRPRPWETYLALLVHLRLQAVAELLDLMDATLTSPCHRTSLLLRLAVFLQQLHSSRRRSYQERDLGNPGVTKRHVNLILLHLLVRVSVWNWEVVGSLWNESTSGCGHRLQRQGLTVCHRIIRPIRTIRTTPIIFITCRLECLIILSRGVGLLQKLLHRLRTKPAQDTPLAQLIKRLLHRLNLQPDLVRVKENR